MREILIHQPFGTQTVLKQLHHLLPFAQPHKQGMTEEAGKDGRHGTSVRIQASLVLLLGRQFSN